MKPPRSEFFRMLPQRQKMYSSEEETAAGIKLLRQKFSPFEEMFFVVLSFLFLFAVIFSLLRLDAMVATTLPARGGTLREAIVGSPRFINPILAQNDADRDMTALVYSGLLKRDENGELVFDAAENMEVSDDRLVYTVTLKEDLTFHDGEPLDSGDVQFTIEKIQDPRIDSPLSGTWQGVHVATPDAHTIIFTLPEAYAPFKDNLTLGILPEHIWRQYDENEFFFAPTNVNAIGSGPYMIRTVDRTEGGAVEELVLHSFPNYALGRPLIERVVTRFFGTEEEALDALNSNDADALSRISPDAIEGISKDVLTATLPRTFALFYNQNESEALRSLNLRRALDESIDRQKLVETVFASHAVPLSSPLTPLSDEKTPSETDIENLLEQAGYERNEEGVLEKGGDPLTLTIQTANVPDLTRTAAYVESVWNDYGITVDIETLPSGDFIETVLRPRRYEIVLFGEVIESSLDLYPFWHSSQRNDPGLNIAHYANIEVDHALETLRSSEDEKEREEAIEVFLTEFERDLPASMLYSPQLLYAVDERIHIPRWRLLDDASGRFSNIHTWHIYEERVWPIFSSFVE